MALTSRITKTLDIPEEPGQTVTIRKLSHHQISMAKDARFDAIIAKAKALEGVTLPPAPPSDAKPTLKDELDRATIILSGVTNWSYDVEPAHGLDDLDEDTAAWLFDEIIAFSIRSAADTKASGSDSLPSTDPAPADGPTS